MPQNSALLALEANAYEKANLAICITDENGVYTSVNDKYAELFEYEASELIGNSFLLVMPKDDVQTIQSVYFEAIKNPSFESSADTVRVTKSGRNIYINVSYRVIKQNDNFYMISAVNDTTEQRAEDEKRRFDQQLLLQQSKITALGEMISAIAHQWRQPLNALGIMIQDVKIAKKFNELTDEYIQNFDTGAMSQIKIMSKTIDDFRNLFRPETTKESFALIGAALEIVSLIDPQLEHHNISANVYSPLDIDEPGEALIYGYPNEFKQLILNMLSNSKDSIIEKQERDGVFDAFINMEIGISKDNGKRYAFVRIIDNGTGIKDEILPRIFEPYFTTKEQGKGTGVGLYMTKMIIEQNMNGTITAANRKGGGAIFEIRFEEGKGVFA
jgi:two-component system CheB/CheR fusion protein